MAAGLTLHFTNLLLMAGMVTIRKGSGFWSYWKETWGIDVVQCQRPHKQWNGI